MFSVLGLVASAQHYNWSAVGSGSQNVIVSETTADSAGNIYTAGYFEGTATFFDSFGNDTTVTSAGWQDCYVTKYSAEGELLWLIAWGEVFFDHAYTIQWVPSGHLYVGGSFADTLDFDPGPGVHYLYGNATIPAYIMKLDVDGNFIWANNYSGAAPGTVVGMDIDSQENIFFCGSVETGADVDPGPAVYTPSVSGQKDAWIQKIDSAGNFIWAGVIGSNYALHESGSAIAVDGNGDAVIIGSFYYFTNLDPFGSSLPVVGNAMGNPDMYAVKVTGTGTLDWAHYWAQSGVDLARSVDFDAANNVYIAGTFSSAMDFDPGPATTTLTAQGSDDGYVLQLDPGGGFGWVRQFGGASSWLGTERCYELQVGSAGNLLVAGAFLDTCDLDPGIGLAEVMSPGITNGYLLQLDLNGNYQWHNHYVADATSEIVHVHEAPDGNILAAAYYTGTLDADAGPGLAEYTSAGQNDVALIHIVTCIDSYDTLNPAVCESYLPPSGGPALTMSGTFTDTLQNACGADSIITINLTVFGTATATIDTTTCNAYVTPSGNQTLTMSGTYADTLTAQSGCDSVLTINLTVLPAATGTLDTTVCGAYTAPTGEAYTTSGTYADTLLAADGCDSILTINLTVLEVNTEIEITSASITSLATGATYQWIDCTTNSIVGGATGQTFAPPVNGTFAVEVTAGNGCSDTSICVTILNASVDALAESPQLRVFPNPSEGSFAVQLLDGGSINAYTITDLSGKVVLARGQLATTLLQVPHKLPAGVYLLTVQSARETHRKRLLVR